MEKVLALSERIGDRFGLWLIVAATSLTIIRLGWIGHW